MKYIKEEKNIKPKRKSFLNRSTSYPKEFKVKYVNCQQEVLKCAFISSCFWTVLRHRDKRQKNRTAYFFSRIIHKQWRNYCIRNIGRSIIKLSVVISWILRWYDHVEINELQLKSSSYYNKVQHCRTHAHKHKIRNIIVSKFAFKIRKKLPFKTAYLRGLEL